MGLTIRCGAQCDLGRAVELHAQLLSGFAESPSVSLDISELESVDLSFVQLIEAARRHAVAEGKEFTLSGPAVGPLANLIDDAGLLSARTPDDLHFWFKGDAKP